VPKSGYNHSLRKPLKRHSSRNCFVASKNARLEVVDQQIQPQTHSNYLSREPTLTSINVIPYIWNPVSIATMKPNEGRLQTAEHILARTIEANFPETRFIISTFKEDSGKIEVSAKTDLRKVDLAKLQNDVNALIQKNLQVKKYIINREEAETQFDLTRLPASVKQVRIVEIEGFDKTPCKDPYVKKTSQIGHFEIIKVKKAGKNTYRFDFKVN
jgi:misacylated tRNA(Ala) deacylase